VLQTESLPHDHALRFVRASFANILYVLLDGYSDNHAHAKSIHQQTRQLFASETQNLVAPLLDNFSAIQRCYFP